MRFILGAFLLLTACQRDGAAPPEFGDGGFKNGDGTGSVSSGYMFSMEPCDAGSYNAQWVTIGPFSPDNHLMKIQIRFQLYGSPGDQWWAPRTISQRQIFAGQPETTACWDRSPAEMAGYWSSDGDTPPGTSSYWALYGAYTKFYAIWGAGNVFNNAAASPSPWVRIRGDVWRNGAPPNWIPHQWYLVDGYHWTMEW